jgi:hypothetical protein
LHSTFRIKSPVHYSYLKLYSFSITDLLVFKFISNWHPRIPSIVANTKDKKWRWGSNTLLSDKIQKKSWHSQRWQCACDRQTADCECQKNLTFVFGSKIYCYRQNHGTEWSMEAAHCLKIKSNTFTHTTLLEELSMSVIWLNFLQNLWHLTALTIWPMQIKSHHHIWWHKKSKHLKLKDEWLNEVWICKYFTRTLID